MEAIGDQLAEFGGAAAVLPRALRGGAGLLPRGYDGEAPPVGPGRLHTVPASAAAAEPQPVPPPAIEQLPDLVPDLAGIGNLLASAAVAAPASLAAADYLQAAAFAGQVEDLSRTVEYLQLVAASTVDRTRTQAITAAATARTSQGGSTGTGRGRAGSTGRAGRSGTGWVTGWDANGVESLNENDLNWPAATAQGPLRPGPLRPGHSGRGTGQPADIPRGDVPGR